MSHVKRRTCYTRRRTRSVGSMPFAWQPNVLLQLHQTQSDEMCSSSTSKDKDCPPYYQSDSDDICSSQREPYVTNLCANVTNNMESDSFNENSPCRRSARRKRKFKRIAMEVEISGNSRFYTHSHAAQSHHSKKKRMLRQSFNYPGSRMWLSSGKRKRTTREKVRNSMDGDSSDMGRDSKVLAISKLSLDDYPVDRYNSMEVSYTVAGVSSSSISSSGSETEIFTNDEGREGDDEQSDWVGEVGLAAGGSFNQNDKDIDVVSKDEMCSYQKYLHGNFETIPAEDKRTCKLFPGKDDMRLTRRKFRTMKPNILSTDERATKFIPAFLVNNTASKKCEMDVESNTVITRRHTFSGLKKRKRIPPSSPLTDNVSDKSSELFLPGGHKLSDISSSDSKDSLQ